VVCVGCGEDFDCSAHIFAVASTKPLFCALCVQGDKAAWLSACLFVLAL
jgi:hypothetical protein